MSNDQCAVVRDLLPLYVDAACGQESKEFVEEHLKNCVSCQRVLARLEARQPVQASAAKDLSMAEVLRILKRSIRFQRIRNAVFVGILAIVFTIGTMVLYSELFRSYNVEVSASELTESKLLITSMGEILFDFKMGDRYCSMIWSTDYEDYELVCRATLLRTVLREPGSSESTNEMYASGICILEDGKAYMLDWYELNGYYFNDQGILFVRAYWGGDDDEEMLYYEREPIRRIYAGTREDSLLLWEEGIEIESCSPAVDRYFTRQFDEWRSEDSVVDSTGSELGDGWDSVDPWYSSPFGELDPDDPWYGSPIQEQDDEWESEDPLIPAPTAVIP